MTYGVEVLAAGVAVVTKARVVVVVVVVACVVAAAAVVDAVACDDGAALEAVEVAVHFVLPSCWRGNRAT